MSAVMTAAVRGTFLAIAWGVLAWPVAPAHAAFAVTLGGVVGAGLSAAGARIRSPWRIGMGTAFALLGVGLAWAASSLLWPSAMFGPVGAIRFADMSAAFGLGCGASLSLRSLSSTRRFGAVGRMLEALAIVAAVASTLSAHRDGMITRPLEVSDWFYARGVDPVVAFSAVGALAAVLVLGTWMRSRSTAQALAVLALWIGLGAFVVQALQTETAGQLLEQAKRPGEGERETEQREGGRGAEEPSPENYQGQQQRRPVAVVVFQKDIEPTGGYFYFRTGTFTRFNGVRLVAAVGDEDLPGHASRFPGPSSPVDLSEQPAPDQRDFVATDVAYLGDVDQPVGLLDPVRFEARPNPSPTRFSRLVHVVSSHLTSRPEELLGRAAGDARWSAEEWHRYTEIPDDARYLELATSLVQDLLPEYRVDPMAQALVIRDHLESTGTYSFRRRYEGSDDPTGEFLFSEERIGYCVHNAHALATLMRAIGVPSRVSVGYAVQAAQKGTGSAVMITSGDAHAWAEIRLEGVGWVPVEVVPEKTEVEPSPPKPFDLQSLLGEMARGEGRWERRASEVDWTWLRRLPWLLPAGVGALLLGAVIVRVFRQLAPAWARPDAQARAVYRAALDNLACMGMTRSTGESWEAFASRVRAEVPSIAPLTEQFLAATLGRPQGRPGASRMGRAAKDAWREARSSAPLWRRWLGPLEVWCWWRVR